MKDTRQPAETLDLELTGATVEAHGYTVTPTARVRGKAGSMKTDQGGGSWAWAAVRPLKVTVADRQGQNQDIRMANGEVKALASMAVIGLVVALISLILPVLVSRRG